MLELDGWKAHSVTVDHHPVEPAVGYLIERRGARIAISGDTAVCDGMRKLADGAHVVIHEALLTRAVSPALLEWNASASSVGNLAMAGLVHAPWFSPTSSRRHAALGARRRSSTRCATAAQRTRRDRPRPAPTPC